MLDTAQIEIPRLENERTERYNARVAYLTMGRERSIEAVRQKIGIRSARRIEQWSAEDEWVRHAENYDQVVGNLAARAYQDKYISDLESHREKAMTSAKNLLALANALARIYADAVQQPQKIKGADGKMYTLHKIAVDTNTLTTIGKAMTSSLDLEAHALGVDAVLGKLDSDSE